MVCLVACILSDLLLIQIYSIFSLSARNLLAWNLPPARFLPIPLVFWSFICAVCTASQTETEIITEQGGYDQNEHMIISSVIFGFFMLIMLINRCTGGGADRLKNQ